ncbi:DUF6907 domain-containing protein [Amycolatopsis pigmentata]|uniref:DUF6907 domain-containing protein n=1 Tax=Amycolatopsis pigmentata TaxID=450801 RepID=A0ABW5FYP3_9PSEU
MKDDRPEWQTSPCPGWCTMTHTDEDFPDDRIHRPGQELAAVLLTTNDPIRGERPERGFEPLVLSVDLEQHARETMPRILLGARNSPGYNLTAPEAVLLGRALLAAGQLADIST